jgi:hypothetical protein
MMDNNSSSNSNAGAAFSSPTNRKHRSTNIFLQDDDDDDDNDDDELSQTTNGTQGTNGIGGGGIAVPPKNVTVNDSLSKELLKLSLNDRNAMEEEIHGVRCLSSLIKETPQLLKEKINEFDIELQKVILLRRNKKRKSSINEQNNKKAKQQQQQQRQQQQQQQQKLGNSNSKTKNSINKQTTEDSYTDSGSDTDVLRNIIPGITNSYNPMQSQQSSQNQNQNQYQNHGHGDDDQKQDKELCYVNDPEVRLRFLRCDSFDSKKAVKRFVSFLEFSKALFGNFIADRPPRISDFSNCNSSNNSSSNNYSNSSNNTTSKSKIISSNNNRREERRALQNSRAQYLPFRDRAGRRIHCLVGKVGLDLDFILRCKIVMYLHWIASEDIETQQKGIVVIAWPSDEDSNNSTTKSSTSSIGRDNNNNSNNSNTNNTSLWETYLRPKIKKRNTEIFKQNFNVALPVRVTSIHFCSKNQPIYKVLSSLYYFSLNSHHKSRYKTHFGDTIEILYKLQSYGIPVDLLPITYSGTVKMNAHSQWVTFRTTVEQQEEKHRIRKQRRRLRNQHEQRMLSQQQQQQQQQQQYQHNQHNQHTQHNQHNQLPPQFISSSNADVIDAAASSAMMNNDDCNDNYYDNNNNNNNNANTESEVILVECPRSYDICFRKGKSFKNNPGNLHFRSLIEETHDSHFMMSERKDKFDMTLKIADQIMNSGSGGQQMRILEWNKKRNAWLLVNDKYAIRQKVANSYKEYKRSCIGRQNALSTSNNNNNNNNTNANANASNANASNANASNANNNNNNNAKSLSLVEAANMTNTNTTTNSNNNNNNNNNTETSGSSSGGRKNQRQFQQQQQQEQQQQQNDLQRDQYMFLQSKRQKITTTTTVSSFLGEVGSTSNFTDCFRQIGVGSFSGSDSGNEDSNDNNSCYSDINSNNVYNF